MTDLSRFSSSSPRSSLKGWLRRFHPARERLRRHPLTRLETVEEVLIAAELGIRIDVNQATVDDWLRLPGISIHQARTLVSLCRRGVVFYALEDIAAALGLSHHHLAPLSPVLQFCYYDDASAVMPSSACLNDVTIAQLRHLPGMSEAIAERIVNERRRTPFTNWSDAQQRLRLTPAQVSQWMHFLKI